MPKRDSTQDPDHDSRAAPLRLACDLAAVPQKDGPSRELTYFASGSRHRLRRLPLGRTLGFELAHSLLPAASPFESSRRRVARKSFAAAFPTPVRLHQRSQSLDRLRSVPGCERFSDRRDRSSSQTREHAKTQDVLTQLRFRAGQSIQPSGPDRKTRRRMGPTVDTCRIRSLR